MVWLESLNYILDPVLNPFITLGSFWAVFLISFFIALLITIVYKYATDQELMKTLKEDMKAMQKEMKKFSKNPEKMMSMQKKAMEKNMKYMMHSMRATLFTFIPLLLIFGWMLTNLAYEPIHPGERFDVYVFLNNADINEANITVPEGINLLSNRTGSIMEIKAGEELHFANPYLMKKRYSGFLTKNEDIYFAGWRMEGVEGDYTLEFNIDGQQYFKDIKISNKKYIKPIEPIEKDEKVKGIAVDQNQLIVIDFMGIQMGWFWSYIIFSILFSMILRKILKVH